MKNDPTLAQLGESGVLERIFPLLGQLPSYVDIGPGDDAAVTRLHGRLVSTADMLVEDEDFTAQWLDPELLGRKAAAQNLADVHAMGAIAHGLLVSIAAPGHTPVSVLEGISRGLATEAARAGCTILGGDLSGGDKLVVAVTALGDLVGPALTRSAAAPGQLCVLAGTTGYAAAGLDLLRAGVRIGQYPVADAAIRTQLAATPDYAAAAALREHAAAMIDCSDGLVIDASRVALSSGVHIDLAEAAITALAQPLVPVAEVLLACRHPQASAGGGRQAEAGGRVQAGGRVHGEAGGQASAGGSGSALGLAREWALTGGEDHGFFATLDDNPSQPGTTPRDVAHRLGLPVIGRVLATHPQSPDRDGEVSQPRTPEFPVTVAGQALRYRGFDHYKE